MANATRGHGSLMSQQQTGRQGFHAQDAPPRIERVDAIAVALSCFWLLAGALFLLLPNESVPGSGPVWVMSLLAVLLPIAMIWIAATAAKSANKLRQEAREVRAELADLQAQVREKEVAGADDVLRRIDDLATRQADHEALLSAFADPNKPQAPDQRAAVADTSEVVPQPSLALGTPAEDLIEPITVAEFIRAMNFPDNEQDSDGFDALRRALEDTGVQTIVRASQDILTLLSQDGIYMDDLTPDRAKPEIWRRFAHGERGRSIAGLGGIHDRSSLALSAGRMKTDPVFRDAVHHFLRNFDRVFLQFEKHASDEEIVRLADTRTARAFMLLGRVTGMFD